MPLSALDTPSWPAFEASLALGLAQLADGEFVSIADGRFVPEPAPERGLFRRVFGGKNLADGGAFVQARRTGHLLYVECVGSRSFGGRHAFSPQQESELAGLGWVRRPELAGEKVYVIDAADPDLIGHVPIGESTAAASAMVATMHEVVGVEHPRDLDLTRG